MSSEGTKSSRRRGQRGRVRIHQLVTSRPHKHLLLEMRHVTTNLPDAPLLRRSSKAIDNVVPQMAAWWRRASPNPRAGVAIELGRGIAALRHHRRGARFAAFTADEEG